MTELGRVVPLLGAVLSRSPAGAYRREIRAGLTGRFDGPREGTR